MKLDLPRSWCHDPPGGCWRDLEAGVEAIELALITALVVVIILASIPLIGGGIAAAFQTVADAFSEGIN